MTNDILLTSKGLNNLLNSGYKGTTHVPTKIRVGMSTDTPTEGDTDLGKKIPMTGTEQVDDCNATTSWSAGTDSAIALNTTLFKESTGSLSLAKSGATVTTFSMNKATTSRDYTSKDFWVWVYLLDKTDLVASGTGITVRFGSDGSNYYYLDTNITGLSNGWNAIVFSSSTATGTTGSPVIAACDYSEIILNTSLSSDTVAANRVLIDDLKVASSGDYEQNFDSGFPLVTETANKVEMETTLGTTKANGYPISEMGHLDTDSSLESHSVFTAENKTTTDIFIMKEIIKLINTTET